MNRINNMTTASLHIRLDQDIKTDAMRVLADMGTSVTEVVRQFLARIASDKALPYVPTAATGYYPPDDGLPTEEEHHAAQEQVYLQYPKLRTLQFRNRVLDV
jgi:addiction module RelB/DinJ family antitoxin